MNLEIVKLDAQSKDLYRWPTQDLLDGTVGVGVVETREILTYVTTQILPGGTEAYSVVRGEMSSSVIDLLNAICSYCNNRATTVARHTFVLPKADLMEFRNLYLKSRIGTFTTSMSFEVELDGTKIIRTFLTYPE